MKVAQQYLEEGDTVDVNEGGTTVDLDEGDTVDVNEGGTTVFG